MYATLMLLAILLNGLNIAATYVLVRSQRYDRHQKLFQAALIWLVPVVGSRRFGKLRVEVEIAVEPLRICAWLPIHAPRALP